MLPQCHRLSRTLGPRVLLQSSYAVADLISFCSGPCATRFSVNPCFSTNYRPTQPSGSPPTLRLLSIMSKLCPRYVYYLGWSLYSLIFSLSRTCALKKHISLWGSLQTYDSLGHLELSHRLSPMRLEDHTLIPRMSVAACWLALDIASLYHSYQPFIGLSMPSRVRPTPRYPSTMSILVSQVRLLARLVVEVIYFLSSSCMCLAKNSS